VAGLASRLEGMSLSLREMSGEWTMASTEAALAGTGVPCDQALHIARLDAETAYRDLSPFRIEITLEGDGWHIDYELRNTRLHGGGPHYVIDAQSAAILSKRYEQ